MAPVKLVEEFKSSHLLNSSTSFTGAITTVTPKFKSSHLLNFSTNFAGGLDLNLGVTGVMAPVKLVEEFNK
jgi:hypothetical protein